eukprot:SAG11_NODE_870_length_6811_cov_36.099508_5_plen_70_part_00
MRLCSLSVYDTFGICLTKNIQMACAHTLLLKAALLARTLPCYAVLFVWVTSVLSMPLIVSLSIEGPVFI